jgi:hypothetical protein
MQVREGFKYVNNERIFFAFPKWFPVQLRMPYEDVRIKVSRKGLTLKKGFAWNGADSFPDYDWIVVPSAVHDAMLWWRHYYWLEKEFDADTDREMKRAIDQWFADLCRSRVPAWRRWTPMFLFFGVNVLSKLPLGKTQVEKHSVKVYE